MLPFAILAGCLGIGVLPALAADQSVAIHDYRFDPPSVAVMPGESVSWQADGMFAHNVHIDGEAAPLGAPSASFSASRQFTSEGTYAYRCDVHDFMRGRVYVNQTGTVPTPSPTASPSTTPTASPTATATTPAGGSGGSGSGGGAGGGDPTGTTAVPVSSFRLRVTVRRRAVFLTLTIRAGQAVRVRGTLRRARKRVRRVSLLARPGRHRVRLPGKALKPGRYTLTLRAGDLRRTVRFRIRRA